MDISLIIPSLNREKLLLQTINEFLKDEPVNDVSIKFEIIVIDQSDVTNQALIELSKKHENRIRYYNLKEKGLPHARNYGITKAIGNIILFCDDDVIPSKNFINNHAKNYTEKNIGGVGGRIITENNEVTNKPEHTQKTGVFKKLSCTFTDNFNGTKRQYIDHAQGCNMSFRKELVLKAGGVDERFGGSSHLEETDLCTRIRAMGYKMIFDPTAELIHLKETAGGCRAANYRKWFYWFCHNYMLFYLKNCKHILFPLFLTTRAIHLSLSATKRTNLFILIWGAQGLKDGWIAYRKGN